jgi:AcrR family transcriptional regulator
VNTDEKILRSALKLFAAQGIDRTSTAQISSDAGVAAGTLFVHFSTKQELIDTLYVRIKRSAFAGLDESFVPGVPFEQNVRAVAARLIGYYLDHYQEMVFLELVEDDPQVSEEALEAGSEAYRELSERIGEQIDSGVLKPLEIRLLQDLMWGMVKSMVKHCRQQKTRRIDPLFLDIIWEAIRN